MTRVAAVDCGTNSIRLLVADVAAGRLTDVVREMRIVRLGQGVDRTGRLAPAGAGAHPGRRWPSTRPRSRDARRRAGAHGRDQRDPRRRQPRRLRGHGAGRTRRRARGDHRRRGGARSPSPARPASGPRRRGRCWWPTSAAAPPSWSAAADGALRAHSMDVGCVRMTERHLHDDPPTRGAGRRPPSPTCARRSSGRAGRRPARGAARRSSAWPARSPLSRRSRSSCDATTRPRSTAPPSAPTRSRDGHRAAAAHDPTTSARRCR